jgi:hypothetical protein
MKLFIRLGLIALSLIANSACAEGIWISADEIAALPTSGKSWDQLKKAASLSTVTLTLSDQNNNAEQYVLAKALVYARTGEVQYRAEVQAACMAAIGTEQGGRTLALGRNLAAIVIAADLVGLDEAENMAFSAWLRSLLTMDLDGRSLQSTHEQRPNNWGTMAGASRAAIAVYLNDTAELERTALVFHGYLGDRTSYAKFKFGERDWQADPDLPVGINPKGAVLNDYNVDGFMPDDLRRGGEFQIPPLETGYPWEALQGVVVQAEILHRAGYPVYEWNDQAILRAVEALYRIDWPAEGDDQWLPHLINFRYGTSFPETLPARHGKIMGWTDWTHHR